MGASSSRTWYLNSFIPEGCANCDRMEEHKVAAKTACHDPDSSIQKTMKTDKVLKHSHQTIVLLGRHRSANTPPINENTKIGAYSATEIIETVT